MRVTAAIFIPTTFFSHALSMKVYLYILISFNSFFWLLNIQSAYNCYIMTGSIFTTMQHTRHSLSPWGERVGWVISSASFYCVTSVIPVSSLKGCSFCRHPCIVSGVPCLSNSVLPPPPGAFRPPGPLLPLPSYYKCTSNPCESPEALMQ